MPERKLSYESLRHKAEGGFLIKAPSLERLFIDAALATTDQMTTLDRIKDSEKKTLVTKGTSKESLMVNWLNEILLLFSKDKFLCKRITFQKFDGRQIEASVFGDRYEPLRHGTIPNFQIITQERLQLGEIHDQDLQFFAKVSFPAR